MSESTIQHIGYDIEDQEPKPEPTNAKIQQLRQELVKEILSKFNLVTRIMIIEAIWGIDVEKELNL